MSTITFTPPAQPFTPARSWTVARSASAAGLAILCGVLFFFQLGDHDLTSSHEARAGQNAQSILDTGDWGLPRLLDGRIEMQKPPLYYWLVAILGWLNGGLVSAWCVRLPAAISALACVLLLWAWCSRRGRPLAGLCSATILATCLHFTAIARTGRIDMPLTLAVTIAVVGLAEGRRLVAYLAIAAGLLLKGPIALALPALVWLMWQRGPRRAARGSGAWWGLPLVFLLALPWYLWANVQTDGEFFRVFFWHHNVDRGFGGEDSLRAFPAWFYGPRLLLDLLPWSLLLPLALLHAWRRPDTEARFGAVWLLTVTAVLSLMRFKRADYLLPAYPGAAILVGSMLEHWCRSRSSALVLGAVSGVAVLVACFWLGYLTFLVPTADRARTHRLFASEVRRVTSSRVLFFQAEAHNVAFHVGRPLVTLLEWENLDIWAGRPQTTYIIMPAECWQSWPAHINKGKLELLCRSQDLAPGRQPLPWLAAWFDDLLDTHERPLVLARTASK
jgi:4-amino-4-deoxy-L-arabinose transferase-like glycosyltransferase